MMSLTIVEIVDFSFSSISSIMIVVISVFILSSLCSLQVAPKTWRYLRAAFRSHLGDHECDVSSPLPLMRGPHDCFFRPRLRNYPGNIDHKIYYLTGGLTSHIRW